MEDVEAQLHDSRRSGEGAYSVRLTAAMRDELMSRDLAHIDRPSEVHQTYRLLACRMCPRCFMGPLSEDEVSALRAVL